MTTRSVAEPQSMIYHFLTFGLKYPDAAALEQLQSVWPIVREVAAELAQESATPAPDPAAFEEALSEAQSISLDDIQVEYTRLFITGFPTTPARAVESVYREGMLVGEAAERVAAFYETFGLQSGDEFVDSIASETEFLAYLSGEELDDDKAYAAFEQGRHAFLKQHFLEWVPDFAKDVTQHGKVKLYLALAPYLSWICRVEKKLGFV